MSDVDLIAFGLNVASGLVANAITSILAQGNSVNSERPSERLVRVNNLRGQIATDRTINAIISKAAAGVARSPQIRDDRLRQFLVSPEAEAIVRELFVIKCARGKDETELTSTIEHDFTAALAAFNTSSPAPEFASTLFKALLAAIDVGLDRAVGAGVVAAVDAKSTIRFKMLSSEIQSLRRGISGLSRTGTTISEISAFENQLRRSVASRHCTIIPPHFDTAVKVPIDDIFVTPTLTAAIRHRSNKPVDFALADVLRGICRAVILGNPGGGKSTLATKICFDLASRYEDRLAAGRELTPLLVVLREYGAEHKEKPVSIVDHIENAIRAKYQINPPAGAVEYLLQAGRLLIIFDGLDELLDTSYRKDISANVESFCALYGNTPVVVTSREVGYEQAPLDHRYFTQYRLRPFDDDQVTAYSQKWFALDADLTSAQKEERATAFLRESSSVSDLRSNPLMLALLCNIYRGENYIPQNRPDVYEKCAVMLFEKWDPSRGIHVELPFQAHIRPALMYVAHWIYGDETLQAGVLETRLIEKTKEYLWPRRFEDPDEAVAAARQFVEFCRGRAWVFTDTGTSKQGDALYQFTHRTFLEYFAAAYLVRTNETAEDLYKELAGRIAAREWDVVAQLAFQVKNKASEEAADRLLVLLLEESKCGGARGDNLLSFAARSLEFLIPSPRIARQIVEASIDSAVSSKAAMLREVGIRSFEQRAAERSFMSEPLFTPLLKVANENRAVVFDEMEKAIGTTLANSKDFENMAVAADLALSLAWPLHVIPDVVARGDVLEEIQAISDRLLVDRHDMFNRAAAASLNVAERLLWREKVTAAQVINWHGLGAMFSASRDLFFSDTLFVSIIATMLTSITTLAIDTPSRSRRAAMSFAATRDALEAIGAEATRANAPWVSRSAVYVAMVDKIVKSAAIDLGYWRLMTPTAAFGLFCALAVVAEVTAADLMDSGIIKSVPAPLSVVVLSRTNEKYRKAFPAELAKLGFAEQQHELVWRWVSRSVSFVSA